ncbi:MAG: ATP-binding protein [Burkholderiales bacterium]
MNAQNPPPTELAPARSSFTLRQRLLLALICVIAAMWAAVAWDARKSEEDAHAQMRQQTAALAMAFADHTEAILQRSDHILLQLREDWLANPKIFAKAITHHQSLLGDTVFQIAVIAADGTLAFSNLASSSERVDLSDREHFKVHKDGAPVDRLFVSRPVKGRVSGKWSIQLTRAIFDGARFAGVVVLSLDPGYFVRYYQRFDLGAQGVVSIVRDTGEMMARTVGQEDYIGKVISTAPATDPGAPLRGSYYRSASQTDGIARLFAYYRLPERGLSTRIGVGVDEFLAPIRAQQRTAWLIASAVTLVLAGLAWLLLGSLTRLEGAESALTIDRQRLAHLAAQQMAMLNNELIGIVTVKDRFIVWANPAFEKMLGYAQAELNGTPTRNNYPSEDAYLAFGTAAYPVLRAGKVFRAQLEHVRKDGTHVWLDASGALLDSETGETMWGFSDISEHIQMLAELKRSNAELEQFSYSISHDMRQPLRMISSYLQLLQKGLGDTLDAEKREYFNFAIDGAQRMDAMMLGLLDYSRVGRKGDAQVWVDSRAVLDDALLYLRPLVAEAQAQAHTEGEWPRILCHPDEMLRLLQNLVGNALKFRVAGRLPQITLTSKTTRGQWQLCVSDNGVGMAPDQIGRLFQVFQRLQSRAAYEGNGIGLALCRKIAEHHDGRIWAQSDGEGLGSRFCMEMPLPKEEGTR